MDFAVSVIESELCFFEMEIEARDEQAATNVNGPPGLITAIQGQDGLKLGAVRAPAPVLVLVLVLVLVIDEVEKPGAN